MNFVQWWLQRSVSDQTPSAPEPHNFVLDFETITNDELRCKMKTQCAVGLSLLLSVFVVADISSAQPSEIIFYQDVSWSPDGSELLLSRMEIKENSYPTAIYVINADGSGYSKLTDGPDDKWTSWSPDGSKIAYASKKEDNVDIYVMKADGSESIRLTTHPANDTHPDWSTNGADIVFVSKRDGTSQIYVMDADGANQQKITDTPENKWNPRWSPDGNKVVFYGALEAGKDSMYVMNADGSERMTLGAGVWPSWSPDGLRIVFTSDKNIYEIKTDGTKKNKLITEGGFARWSPDGKKIAVIRQIWRAPQGWPAASALFLIGADGSGEVRLTKETKK